MCANCGARGPMTVNDPVELWNERFYDLEGESAVDAWADAEMGIEPCVRDEYRAQ